MREMLKVVIAGAGLIALLGSPAAAQGPLATIGEEEITAEDRPVTAQERKLVQQLYQVQMQSLQGAITARLLEIEAERQGIPVSELVQKAVAPRVGMPTNKEVSDFYNERKEQIGKPLKEVRAQIVKVLRDQEAQQHLSDYVSELRSNSQIEVHLDAPRLPVDLDGARIRGPEDAPVTIVEFSDFQCPYCKRVQPVLTELAEQYGDQVRWVFKDLPLADIHPDAVRAAQVARCAGDQGKFWEYRSKLFEQELFTDGTYQEIAQELKVKPAALIECADSKKHEEAVTQETAEARGLGIDGTPAILVNGVLLTGARPIEAYRAVIDRELKDVETASP